MQAARPELQDLSYIGEAVSRARNAFDSGRTRSFEWRLRQLKALHRMLSESEQQICEALKSDLGKPFLEGYSTEVAFCTSETEMAIKKLRQWMKPKRVPTSMLAQPGRSRIYHDPLGVVLIISPWNYPWGLLIAPMIGALAAGNCVLLKPSEVASATSALIARLVPRYLDPDCVKVIEGAIPEATELLAQRFDHILYTGNGSVARIVMAAAAKNLTPVTLELGGKSPCIIDSSADLDLTVRRICWGKFSNSGQTCVAPDYLLVQASVYERVLQKLAETIRTFYGDDPQKSPDYGRIINERHHQRLMKLIGSGRVVIGGKGDQSDRYIAPTVLADVELDSPVMQEEIFGPILPVIKVADTDEVIRFVNARPKPLALYIFSTNSEATERILTRTSSGGATVNHTFLHLSCPALPFGGVGESGMGNYHGKFTFHTFTHHKAVLKKPSFLDPDLLYPPYDEKKAKWIKRLL